MGKMISLDKLQSLSVQLRSIFATKSEVADKVDKVDGKELSDNNFTDRYKSICDYAIPLEEDGVLSLALKGPDGKIYRLAINDDFRLVLEEHINAKQVTYLRSGSDYYYLEEDETGVPYLSKLTTSLPTDATVGYLRTVSGDDGVKYQIGVEGGSIIFTPHEGTGLDEEEAKYLVCKNNPEKVYYFKIEQGQIFLERITVETVSLRLK